MSENPFWREKVRIDVAAAKQCCKERGLVCPITKIEFVEADELKKILPPDEFQLCVRERFYEVRPKRTVVRKEAD